MKETIFCKRDLSFSHGTQVVCYSTCVLLENDRSLLQNIVSFMGSFAKETYDLRNKLMTGVCTSDPLLVPAINVRKS